MTHTRVCTEQQSAECDEVRLSVFVIDTSYTGAEMLQRQCRVSSHVVVCDMCPYIASSRIFLLHVDAMCMCLTLMECIEHACDESEWSDGERRHALRMQHMRITACRRQEMEESDVIAIVHCREK